MRTFGHRLKKLRDDLQLTQGQVAKAIGVSQKAISALETFPDRVPSSENLRALAAYFQVDPDWLLTGKGQSAHVSSLSTEESELLLLFRSLSPAGRAYILSRTHDLHKDEHRPGHRTAPAQKSPSGDDPENVKRIN